MDLLHATFRRPGEPVGIPTTMRDATACRVADALARLDGPYAVTLWLDPDGRVARLVSIDGGEYTVDVLSRGRLWAVSRPERKDEQELLAPLNALAAEVRGTPTVRPAQILGVVSAVRFALTWMHTGQLGPRARLAFH